MAMGGYSSGEDVLAMPIEVFTRGALSTVRKQKGLQQWRPPVVLPGEMITANRVSQ